MTEPRPSKFGAGHTYGGSKPAPAYDPMSQPAYQGAPYYGQATPNGATAIIAGLLALVGGGLVAYYTDSINLVRALANPSSYSAPDLGQVSENLQASATIYAACALLGTAGLLLGGIVLVFRQRAGRWLIVAGFILVTVAIVLILSTIISVTGGQSDILELIGKERVAWLATIIGVPLIASAFAMAPSTGRWCR